MNSLQFNRVSSHPFSERHPLYELLTLVVSPFQSAAPSALLHPVIDDRPGHILLRSLINFPYRSLAILAMRFARRLIEHRLKLFVQ